MCTGRKYAILLKGGPFLLKNAFFSNISIIYYQIELKL